MTSAKPSTLAEALLAFQAEGLTLQKDATNPHYRSRYLSLDALLETVLPVLNKHGLVISQSPVASQMSHGVLSTLKTRLIHAASGESIEDSMLLMAEKDTPQAQGAAITYARRYSLMSMLGLVADEDTDGHIPARTGAAGKGAGPTSHRDTGGEKQPQVPSADGEPSPNLSPEGIPFFDGRDFSGATTGASAFEPPIGARGSGGDATPKQMGFLNGLRDKLVDVHKQPATPIDEEIAKVMNSKEASALITKLRNLVQMAEKMNK